MVEMSVADKVAFDLVLQHMPNYAVGRALRYFDVPEDALVLSDLQPVDKTAGITCNRVAIPVGPDEVGAEITSKPCPDRATVGIRSIDIETSDAISLMKPPTASD
jgi:hypothetical protein